MSEKIEQEECCCGNCNCKAVEVEAANAADVAETMSIVSTELKKDKEIDQPIGGGTSSPPKK